MGLAPDDPRIVIDSEAVEPEYDGGISNPFPALESLSDLSDSDVPPVSSGDSIPDAGIAGNDGEAGNSPPEPASPRKRVSRLRSATDDSNSGARDATGKPPSLDEWVNFFGKVVLKISCDWYLSYAFRGIDEDMLTDREIDRLAMSDDERKLIATPLAELSNKSKFMRKHGRTIVASGDSFRAMVVLGAWMSRVNRIAAKYRPRHAQVKVNMPNGSSGQAPQTTNGATYAGSQNGHVPSGYPVYRPGTG